VCAAVVLNLALVGIVFGTDPETKVALGLLATYCVASSVIIAGLLAGFMAYRTSLLMQDLARARVELLRQFVIALSGSTSRRLPSRRNASRAPSASRGQGRLKASSGTFAVRRS
jgi:hypothetical protein